MNLEIGTKITENNNLLESAAIERVLFVKNPEEILNDSTGEALDELIGKVYLNT